MKKSLMVISVSTAIFIIITYVVGESSLVLKGFNNSINTAVQSALMLLASFIIIGLLAQRFFHNRTIENLFTEAGEKDGSNHCDS